MLGVSRAKWIEVFSFLLWAALAFAQVLPRPQIASAEGKSAPNFTLKDQHGKDFRLSALRGKRVLLIFYRGYW
jgi:cytochrome oxidase Cu insertion factor (SCO1/SenC/PrrC family)